MEEFVIEMNVQTAKQEKGAITSILSFPFKFAAVGNGVGSLF